MYFMVKLLLLAQMCDRTFGGFLIFIRACRKYQIFAFFLHPHSNQPSSVS